MLSYSEALDCKPLTNSLFNFLFSFSIYNFIILDDLSGASVPLASQSTVSTFSLRYESNLSSITPTCPLALYRSLSVEHTASDIYKGLKQGRDVVVPGLVNKLYTYLFSQILPSAAVGAITQVHYTALHYTNLTILLCHEIKYLVSKTTVMS